MQKIKVQWLLDGNPNTLEQVFNSNLASIRMRAALSMRINDKDLSVKLVSDLKIDKDTNILGIGKFSVIKDPNLPIKWLGAIDHHKKNGGKVFLDYTDNHLRASNKNSDLYNAYQEFIKVTDYVVTSSNYLKNEITKNYNPNSSIIEDPLEFNLIKPKKETQSILTGIWFGHASNLDYLFNFLQKEFRPSAKVRILIMSNFYPFPNPLIQTLNNNISPYVELCILPWSLKDMKLAATVSDFCIIPCGIGDDRKEGVSSNRLVTALALGLPCFADAPPSYKEFSSYFSPLNNESLDLFFLNPDIFKEKTYAAQKIILNRFSKKTILTHWRDLFFTIVKS